MCCCGRATRLIASCLCLLVAVAPAAAVSQMRCAAGQTCPHPTPAVAADNHACCAPQPRHCDPTPAPTSCVEVRVAPAPFSAERSDTPVPAHAPVGLAPTPPPVLPIPALTGLAAIPTDLPQPIHLGIRQASPRGPPIAR